MNKNAHFFSIYGGHLRGRYQMLMQNASQELAQMGAAEAQKRQFLMDMLKEERDKLKEMKKLKFNLVKDQGKEGAGKMRQYLNAYAQWTNLYRAMNENQSQHFKRYTTAIDNVEKRYVPSDELIKSKAGVLDAADNNISQLSVVSNANELNTLISGQSKLGASINALKTMTNNKTVADSKAVTDTVKALRENLNKQNPSFALTEDELGEALFKGSYAAHKQRIQGDWKKQQKDDEAAEYKKITRKVSSVDADAIENIRDLQKKIDKLKNQTVGPNAETVENIFKVNGVSPEDITKQNNALQKLRDQLQTSLDKDLTVKYEDVRERAGEMLLAEEGQQGRIKAAEDIMNMDDAQMAYYASVKGAQKYRKQEPKDFTGNSGKFVQTLLSPKYQDKSWNNLYKQVQDSNLSAIEKQDAVSMMVSRFVNAGAQHLAKNQKKSKMVAPLIEPVVTPPAAPVEAPPVTPEAEIPDGWERKAKIFKRDNMTPVDEFKKDPKKRKRWIDYAKTKGWTGKGWEN